MDAHAQVQRAVGFARIQLGRGVDDLQPAQHRARGRREDRMDRVALGLDLGTLVARDGLPSDLEEAADLGGRGGIAVALGKRGEPAHV